MDVIKRSILLQVTVPIVVLLIVGLCFIGLYIPVVIKEDAINSAINSSKQTIENYKSLRHYYTVNVVNKVLAEGNLKPSIQHKDRAGTIPLPATLIHDLSALMVGKGMQLNLYSAFPFPNRQSRQLDQFQKDSWQALNEKPDRPFIRVDDSNNQNIVQVAIADKMVAQACVNCHNSHPDTPKNNWRLGDIRGVLAVKTNIQDAIENGQLTAYKIIAILTVILILIVAFMVNKFKGINNRLVSLGKGLIKAASGDLTEQVNVSGIDELSILGQKYNEFLNNMRNAIREIVQSSAHLSQQSQNLRSVNESARENVSLQKQETDQVATAMNQMSGAVNEVAASASGATNATKHADEEAQRGHQTVSEAINSINRLAQEVNEAVNVIQQLEQDSNQIGTVLDVIGGIAEQTNLLALNAAIEAARAGERGRGFAVVADEVRTLAGRTQQSTSEIQSMIEKLQTGVRNAVTVMDKSGEYTQNSVDHASAAGDALKVINETVATINEMNTQIASAAEQQSAVAKEVSNNIEKINLVADQSVETIENTAIASEKLEQMADELQALTSRFIF